MRAESRRPRVRTARVWLGTVAGRLRPALAFLVLPAALTAQETGAPPDWTWRLDGEQRLVTGEDLPAGSWRYVSMPPGWHVTTTEQGVSLFPKDRLVEGRFGVEAEVFLFPDPSDAPLGIVLEAADAPEGSRQLRFLMRRDGATALVATHAGTDTTLVSWQADTTGLAHPGDGIVKYVLRVTHEAGALAFTVNGHETFAMPTAGEEHPTRPGLRLGPGLNAHVSRFDLITPLAPPRTR